MSKDGAVTLVSSFTLTASQGEKCVLRRSQTGKWDKCDGHLARVTPLAHVTAGEATSLFVGHPACVEMGRSPANPGNLCGSTCLMSGHGPSLKPRVRAPHLRIAPQMLFSSKQSLILFLKGGV